MCYGGCNCKRCMGPDEERVTMTNRMTWTTNKPTQLNHMPAVKWNRKCRSWDQVLKRILDKTEKVTESGCWIWMGADKGEEGYGRVYICEKAFTVHRIVYGLLVGPISDGLVLDHLCRVRLCINPYHLEPVTDKVNILRGEAPNVLRMSASHCINGHKWTSERMRIYKGRRFCRDCEMERSRRRKHALDSR